MTERRGYRDVLVQLNHRVSAFVYSNNTLETPLELTPGFLFIQCMDEELNQRFDSAIEKFNILAQHQEAPMDLRIRCLYWKGYIQNNIGDFNNAQASFQRANHVCQQDNQQGRSYWLDRLRIETMLFSRTYRCDDLVQRLDNVINEVHNSHIVLEEQNQMRDALELTKSNIYQAAAMDAWFAGHIQDAKDFMTQSLDVLQGQMTRNIPAALREYAFGSIMLQQNVPEAESIINNSILDSARNGLLTHIGTRHKAYYTAILAMCHSALGNRDRVMDYQTRAAQYVAEVHDRMFVYSPLTKRNVEREEFLDEIRKIVNNFIVF
jgi:tetratricopeptide (TPR) repeat protein